MAKVIGLEKVMVRLNSEIVKIKGASLAGLIRTAALIRNDMEKTSPKTPVDLGNLRSSWFVTTSTGAVPSGRGREFKGDQAGKMMSEHGATISEGKVLAKTATHGPGLAMGFSANYAEFVHENMGRNFKRPGSGAKFFESAIDRNRDKILGIIQQSVKLKK